MATGITKVYLKHFVNNVNSRWVLLQGGRRSGKSFAIYKWLHILVSGQPKVCGIVAASFPALQLAINDFSRATGLVVSGNTIFGFSVVLSNGSKFIFRSFDTPEKCQGSTFDILYIEEALNIPEQVVSVLSMSVSGQIFAAYNPTKSSYLDKYLLKDKSNLLVTTFKDNPYLTPEQCEEFEHIKHKALSPTASLLDVYNYKVYYLGEFGEMSGKVFKMIYTITDEEYNNIQANELYAIDFGWVAGEQNDATALIGCKILDGKAYFKQYIYSSQLANNKELAFRMAELGLDCYSNIVGDYGGLGSSRIKELVTAGNYTWTEPEIKNGINVSNAIKGKIIDGLNRMNQYEMYVTDTSVDLRYEFDNYELNAEGKPKNGVVDHALDACRYAVNSYSNFFY